ncbi:hypothetical protein Tco_0615818 [Tanacetum coccineum]
MQEFWATATVHHHSIRFKMNKKKHIMNLEYFKEMLQICPNPQFEELPFEEAILTFLRDLGHSGEIKMITDVNVNKLHQPWRSFAAVINKCLSGKSTGYDSLRLSQAQILWGMYHKKNVDYAYLWREMFQFIKVGTRMSKRVMRCTTLASPRDDYMFTTIKVVSRHEDTQLYGAILPNELTNEDIRNSESYKEYYAIASGAEPPKTKASVKKKQVGSDKTTTLTKTAKPAKKKQPAKTSMDKEAKHRLTALTPANTKLTVLMLSAKVADDGNCEEKHDDDQEHDDQDDDANDDAQDKDDQDDENQDDDNEQTDSDNDGDDFVYPKFSTHDDEAKQYEEVNEEDSFDPRVQTPSHVESTDDEDNDDEIQDANVEGDKINEEETNDEAEVVALYRDVNVNLEGKDTGMTDAPLPNVQATQETKDTHMILIALINPEGRQQSSSVLSGFVSNMLNPRPDTGIDSIFNTEATSLIDVPVTTIAEPPLVSATTLPPPPTPLTTHMQQTPVPTPTIVPSSSLQDLPNFGSLFGFDHRLKTLETDFSEFKQTNQFAEAVSSIPGIVDAYLANKMNEAVKTAVQLQSDRLRDEAQAENEDFLNKLDDNIKKIIKDQVKEQVKAQVSKILPRIKKTVNEQLEAEVLTRSSIESKTSLAIAANLSELELKKILIEKMESNKSIHRSNEQKNLYKALVEAYESDKLILDTYGDTVSFKRRRDDEDKDEEPSEFDIGATEEQSNEETSQHPDWFQKLAKHPTLDRDWNKTLHAVHGPVQPWLSNLAREEGPRESFDELMMNQLKIDTLTPKLLVGPTFELMKGTCKSLVELEYFFEEVYKATTDRLDWHNPKGQQYPHDLIKTLPLIPNSRGCQVIPFDHFINNDLAYLSGGIWSPTQSGVKCRESARDVCSKRRIIAVTKLQIIEWHGYKHLDWIIVRRDDDKPYTFKEGNFKWLRLQDIEYMLILLVQGKLTNLNVEYRLAFGVSLRISDLKRRDAYIAYSNPRGFIYQNKDKKNKLMRIDELYKFSDGTLDDVRTALNDRLKGIRMEYLLKTIWRQKHAEFDESDTHVLERFNTLAGNPVKEILLKLNVPDHMSILMDLKVTPTKHGQMAKPYSSPHYIANCFNVGYLKMEEKLKNFKKDATLKLFKSTNQERYEHVGPEVTSSQDDKVYKIAKRDYTWLVISRCSRSHSRQAKEQAQRPKVYDHYLKSQVND